MDGSGSILILCIIGIIASTFALMMISNKKKSVDDSGSTPKSTTPAGTPAPPSPYSSRGLRFDSAKPGASGVSGSAAAPSGPSQITIHAYVPVKKTRCCPICDGENNVTAKFCFICGKFMG